MATTLNNRTAAREQGYQMVQYIAGRITATGAFATTAFKVGTLPAGAVPIGIGTRVVTAITGTTPTFNLGTTTNGTEIAAAIALTVGSVTTAWGATPALPLAVDTDVWANITGTATGDAVIIVSFVKPLT